MNKDDIIKLAQKAGFVEYELDDGTTNAFDVRYARFANLVAAAEREACAGLAERRLLIDKSNAKKTGHHYACKSILADIQARGTT